MALFATNRFQLDPQMKILDKFVNKIQKINETFIQFDS